jgi:hypothetical protein
MDPVNAVSSSPSLLEASTLSASEGALTLSPALPPWTRWDPAATFDSLNRSDPVRAQQLIQHFISHIDAACFVSLIQILDRRPDDERYRAEYDRRYRLLRQALELPPPLPETRPVETPIEILR